MLGGGMFASLREIKAYLRSIQQPGKRNSDLRRTGKTTKRCVFRLLLPLAPSYWFPALQELRGSHVELQTGLAVACS